MSLINYSGRNKLQFSSNSELKVLLNLAYAARDTRAIIEFTTVLLTRKDR